MCYWLLWILAATLQSVIFVASPLLFHTCGIRANIINHILSYLIWDTVADGDWVWQVNRFPNPILSQKLDLEVLE